MNIDVGHNIGRVINSQYSNCKQAVLRRLRLSMPKINRVFILIGGGANGKSTFLNTLHHERLHGRARCIVSKQRLEQKYGSQQTNDLPHLLGKRLVTASEGEQGQKLVESKVKLMTGGDMLSCRYLYRNLFEYKPQFKLWLATNNLPTITGTDEAIGDESEWFRSQSPSHLPTKIRHLPVGWLPNSREFSIGH